MTAQYLGNENDVNPHGTSQQHVLIQLPVSGTQEQKTRCGRLGGVGIQASHKAHS